MTQVHNRTLLGQVENIVAFKDAVTAPERSAQNYPIPDSSVSQAAYQGQGRETLYARGHYTIRKVIVDLCLDRIRKFSQLCIRL